MEHLLHRLYSVDAPGSHAVSSAGLLFVH